MSTVSSESYSVSMSLVSSSFSCSSFDVISGPGTRVLVSVRAKALLPKPDEEYGVYSGLRR